MQLRASKSPSRWKLAALVATLALAAGVASCRGAATAFGPDARAAIRHSDDLFGALAARFSSVARSPGWEYARKQLAEDALVPSRIFADSAVWTEMSSPTSRTLLVRGSTVGDRYRIEKATRRSALADLVTPGDARHVIVLDRTRENEYVWDTTVDFALGSVSPDEIAELLGVFWRAPEGRTGGELRSEIRGAFPRTSASLGRLFTIEALRPIHSPDGTTTTTLAVFMHPATIEARFPKFASWLEKYAGSSRFHFRVTDAAGATWLDVAGADSRATLVFRSSAGRLAPLAGPPRPLPDSLRLTIDWTMKVKLFRIGVRNLVTDVRLERRGDARSVLLVARREPDWSLPLVTERLIRSPLRHPFEGAGVVFSLALREVPGSRTVLVRRAHLAVRESGILRFLAGLATHTARELDEAEREQDVFLHETFVALAGDSRALIAGGAPE